MPFISTSSRKKRGRSSWIFFPSQKVRILEHGNFDGTTTPQNGIKARFRRRGSRVMSLLGISSREDREDENPNSQLTTARNSFDHGETSSTIVKFQSQQSWCGSSIVPGLTHRLSHKLSSTFGHPTVVHRTGLRSRPSVHSVREALAPTHADDPPSSQNLSAASTYNSGSSSSPAQVSTNPTSDALSASPIRSTARHPLLADNSRILTFSRDMSAPRLTPISETPHVIVPSIITVEATATAKIFFETHFRQILSSHRPRSQRKKDLEAALENRNWSPAKRHKARATFLRQENEFLRQGRVLKSKANAMKKTKGVSIAGYEVIKVLGKGSFGVVRLVKENTQSKDEGQSAMSLECAHRSSKTDLAALKSTARGAFPLLGSKRKDLTRVRKEVYAMKVIRKSEMLRNSQEGHLRAERDFLVSSENSRWVVPLIAAFQDHRNLYLVMDYCVGGDFLGLLIRKNMLSEDVTRWYIAEMILCVEEAHSLRWIHRDVKPDNFLIDATGHLKISDFGLAFDGHWSHDQAFFHNHRHSLMEKLGIEVQGDEQDQAEADAVRTSQDIGKVMARSAPPSARETGKAVEEPADDEPLVDWRDRQQRRKLAQSVVGTSQYMAPEVIRGDPYDGRCDWWSIGIILYECLFGFTPFACENRQETKLKILKHRTTLRFPDDQYGFPPITSTALDLIRRLLREKEERLSSPKYYLNDFAYSQAQGTDTYHIHGPADKSSKNYQGRHVYSDDADDIKAHAWFRNTDWTQIHRKKPPFIPKVKGWEDTKYFDDDESVDDLESSSSEEGVTHPAVLNKENMFGLGNAGKDRPLFEDAVVAAADVDHHINKHRQEDQHILPSNAAAKVNDMVRDQSQRMLEGIRRGEVPGSILGSLARQKTTAAIQTQLDGVSVAQGAEPQRGKPKKEKKRPRDKILRDPATGKVALEMRRKGAFLGYAYRRPKKVNSVLDRVEAEAETVRIERLLSPRNEAHVGRLHGPRGFSDPRRDSAIAGIERPMGAGFSASGRTEVETMIKGRGGGGSPSPRCITPVENGMVTRRPDLPRFGMI